MTQTKKNYRTLFSSRFSREQVQLPKQLSQQQLEPLKMLLIALLALVVFLAQFQLREFDDNRLTSWLWVFTEINFIKIFALLVFGMVLAYGLSYLSQPERKPVIYLFFGSFTAMTLLWNIPEVIIDSSRYFIHAKYLEIYGISAFLNTWGLQQSVWTDLPLMPILYGLLYQFFGESRFIIQILNTLLFAGSVVLTYLIGMKLWNRTLAWIAALLLFGMPYLLTQVPLMLVDVPTMFFLTLMIFLIIKVFESNSLVSHFSLLLMTCFSVALVMLVKYSTWLMLSIIPVIALCYLSRGYEFVIKRLLLIVLGSTLLVSLFVIFKFDVIREQINLLINYQWPGLGRWRESYGSSLLFQIHPFITFAALLSIYLAVKDRDRKYIIIIFLPLLLVLLGVQRFRYIIPVLPLFALMAAYSLSQIKTIRTGKFLALTTAVYGIVIANFVYQPFLQSTSMTNIKQAGLYLNSSDADLIEVITLASNRSIVNPAIAVPLLDLFTHKPIVYTDNTNNKKPAGINKSPLRFTWEWRNPDYYLNNIDSTSLSKKRKIIVVVSGHPKQIKSGQLTEHLTGYSLSKQFDLSDKVFKFQTIIRIYEPTKLKNSI